MFHRRFIGAVAILLAAGHFFDIHAWGEKREPGLYAILTTSRGKIVCKLSLETPQALRNFGLLAQGATEWTDPSTGQKVRKKYYENLSFHKVVPGTLIETGDPLGNGTGGPGFLSVMELVPGLSFDEPGRLALANDAAGPNGGRFFITVKPMPQWNGQFTIFGTVVKGLKVARKISEASLDDAGRPIKAVWLESVLIERVENP